MKKMMRPSLSELLNIGCDIRSELEGEYDYAVEAFHEQLSYKLAEEFPEWVVEGYSPQVLMLAVANAKYTREIRMLLTAIEQLYLNGYLLELNVSTYYVALYDNIEGWSCTTYLDIIPTDFNPNPVSLPQEILHSDCISVDLMENITTSVKLALAKIQSW